MVCVYLSGAEVDVLGPALVPVGQQLDGRLRCAEPQKLWSLFVQKTVIIEQVLVQDSSEDAVEGEWGVFYYVLTFSGMLCRYKQQITERNRTFDNIVFLLGRKSDMNNKLILLVLPVY